MLAVRDAGTRADTEARPARVSGWRRLQLCVASLWLLDSVLQAQVFMFSRGFGRMQSDGPAGAPDRQARD
jgi:hypothetical protein